MTMMPPTPLDELRAAVRAMLNGWPRDIVRGQAHPELSPLAWHVGHVFFVETYWLQERVFGDTRVTDRWRDLYFPEECPKQTRSARLPEAEALLAWTRAVAEENDGYWERAAAHAHPLLDEGYLAAFLRQHYAQHLETMRMVVQQQTLTYCDLPKAPATLTARPPTRDSVSLTGGPVRIGTDGVAAYDNEKPAFDTRVNAFEIARRPVGNGEWLGFMQAGCYDNPAYWDAAGWRWRETTQVCCPEHWHAHPDGGWCCPDSHESLASEAPVHGIGWFEARAFARYADARLPLEYEWEYAARHDVIEDVGRVWEWCDDAFHPYAGFEAFPYEGYSRPWFDGAHFVARGGSRYTEADIRRPGFRNFYPPAHRHVFAGLRLAW